MDEGPKRYSLRLPDELWERLDRCAKLLHTSMHRIIIEAIVVHLVELEKKLDIKSKEDRP